MVTAISQDLDDLGFVVGKEFIQGGRRQSGRTTRLLREALHQLDFMDPGDEIWVVSDRWSNAKTLCEMVGNKLAAEMGFDATADFPPKLVHRWGGIPGRVRYHLSFSNDKIIHFCTVDSLPKQLIGVRLTHNPAIFFDHICYEFGAIENARFDLYDLLSTIG